MTTADTTDRISVDVVNTPGGIGSVLRRLSAGDVLAFFERDVTGQETACFSLQRNGDSYEIRDVEGRSLGVTPSFAEAWRRRPRTSNGRAL